MHANMIYPQIRVFLCGVMQAAELLATTSRDPALSQLLRTNGASLESGIFMRHTTFGFCNEVPWLKKRLCVC